MKSPWLVRLALLITPAALAQACSLVNSYDDVLTGVDSGGAPDTGGPGVDADSGAGDADAGSNADADADGPPIVADAQTGAVVVSARGDKDGGGSQYVLSVLDPATGKELSREVLPVIAAFFDGQRDLWYILEAPGAALSPSGPLVGPGEAVFLRVRELDTHTGEWTELAKTKIPALISAEQVAILKERLAYIAYPPDGGTSNMVVLNTTNPSGISADASADASSVTALPFNPVGLIGTRSTTNNVGGLVTLIQSTCDIVLGTCSYNIQGVSVGAAVNFKTNKPLTTIPSTATIGWGSHITGGSDVFITPDGGTSGLIQRYAPQTNDKTADPVIAFNATSSRFRPITVSECRGVAFVSLLNASDVFAIPLAANGTQANIATGHSNSSVVYEPYTNTLFVPFSGSFTPIGVSGSKLAPQLAPRATFKPPADIKPHHVATRQPLDPLDFECAP